MSNLINKKPTHNVEKNFKLDQSLHKKLSIFTTAYERTILKEVLYPLKAYSKWNSTMFRSNFGCN